MTDVIKFFLIFYDFLSVKMPWVRIFFTTFEILSPDGYVVSGNLRRNFLLHDLYEFLFHTTIISENSLLVFHGSHKDTEQSTIQRIFCNTWRRNTDWPIDQVITKWMTFSLPEDITVSAVKTFWEDPWTSDMPAQWTIGTFTTIYIAILLWRKIFMGDNMYAVGTGKVESAVLLDMRRNISKYHKLFEFGKGWCPFLRFRDNSGFAFFETKRLFNVNKSATSTCGS
jgi:hypothetical protein